MTDFRIPHSFKHLFFILLITFFIVFQYFYVNQFSRFTWYHEFDNDSDPSYAAQTWAIVNGGKVMYLHHPGVTVYAVDGFIYKALSFFDKDFQRLTNIKTITSDQDALETLNLATQTGRQIALFTVIIFLILIYFIIFLLTSNALIAFLISIYVFLSNAVIQYSGIIRPEVYSLIFLLCAVLLCLMYFKNVIKKKSRNELIVFILTGVFFCLSVFSKIQIALYILFSFLLILYLLVIKFKSAFELDSNNSFKISVLLSLVNIIITPWWALKKPSFLTSDYLKSIAGNDFGRIYGPAPDSFIPIVALGLFGLFLISLLLLDLKDHFKPRWRIYMTAITFINSVITGSIIAAYVVLLPVFHDLKSYLENTHHIVYALITNIFYAGFMENPHLFSMETIKNIFTLHSRNSQILFINPLIIVGSVTLFILFRLRYNKDKNKRSEYIFALAFIMIAFMMDYFSTMRWTTLYDHYAVYSLPVYLIGIACFLKTEFGDSLNFRFSKNPRKIVAAAIMSLLLLNACIESYSLVTKTRANLKPNDMPDRQLSITKSIVKPFWEMIDSVVITSPDIIGTPRMISNEKPEPFKVIYSTQYNNENWAAYRAFDKLKDWYGWHSQEGTTGYIGLNFGINNGRIFSKYSLTSTISYMDYMPKDFNLEVSNDGKEWLILDQQTNQTNWSPSETRTFSFINKSSYQYYRINISSNNGAAHLLVSEIAFE